MSILNYETATCDRCGIVEDLRPYERGWAWGKTFYQQVNGPLWNVPPSASKPPKSADICPRCLTDLHAWWNSKKSKEQQP